MIAIYPKIAECAIAGEREKLVCIVREYFAGERKFAPRLDVESLCTAMGVVVEKLPMDGQAALVARDDKQGINVSMVLNPKMPAGEQRFALAHLLGHLLLHIQPQVARAEYDLGGFKEMTSPERRYANMVVDQKTKAADRQRDLAADEFAAALLLPQAMLQRAMAKLQDLEKVAAFFGVNLAILKNRLETLGWAQRQPESFLAAEESLRQTQVTGQVLKKGELGAKITDLTPPATVEKPLNMAKVQKVMAKTSYGAQEKEESEYRAREEKPAKGRQKKGMARLREIAQKLDKSVEK